MRSKAYENHKHNKKTYTSRYICKYVYIHMTRAYVHNRYEFVICLSKLRPLTTFPPNETATIRTPHTVDIKARVLSGGQMLRPVFALKIAAGFQGQTLVAACLVDQQRKSGCEYAHRLPLHENKLCDCVELLAIKRSLV